MVANSVFLTQETQESGDADFSGTLKQKKQEDIEKPSSPEMQIADVSGTVVRKQTSSVQNRIRYLQKRT
jgi:hypothetical protein